ncbi:hypothetical protein HYQ46_000640 [Verticillium longisporum]|nr:hypothetical protein HYQ46_000640 [Verticillium longisporum]
MILLGEELRLRPFGSLIMLFSLQVRLARVHASSKKKLDDLKVSIVNSVEQRRIFHRRGVPGVIGYVEVAWSLRQSLLRDIILALVAGASKSSLPMRINVLLGLGHFGGRHVEVCCRRR